MKDMPQLRALMANQGSDLPTFMASAESVKHSMMDVLDFLALFPMNVRKTEVIAGLANISNGPELSKERQA